MILSTREKLLIVLLVALVAGIGLFYTLRGMRSIRQDLEKRIAVSESFLQQATALSESLARLNTAKRRPGRVARTGSLIGYVEQLAARIQLKDRIQLNLIPKDSRSGLQGIDIKVNDLTLDEMVNLLYALENADSNLVIQQLELGPSFRTRDLLRLSLRVLALG